MERNRGKYSKRFFELKPWDLLTDWDSNIRDDFQVSYLGKWEGNGPIL